MRLGTPGTLPSSPTTSAGGVYPGAATKAEFSTISLLCPAAVRQNRREIAKATITNLPTVRAGAKSQQTNRTCVLQYTTDLSAPDWINVSANVVPNGSLTLTDVTNGDTMRFYRVFVVP